MKTIKIYDVLDYAVKNEDTSITQWCELCIEIWYMHAY